MVFKNLSHLLMQQTQQKLKGPERLGRLARINFLIFLPPSSFRHSLKNLALYTDRIFIFSVS